MPKTTKNYFLKSFIPLTKELWNNLPLTARTQDDPADFELELMKIYKPTEIYKPHLTSFSDGCINLLITKMGLSGLNSHRRNFYFIDYNICPHCQSNNENEIHFLLTCTGHAAHRQMITQLQPILPQYNHLLMNLAPQKHHKELL